jgi:hypothetical protein
MANSSKIFLFSRLAPHGLQQQQDASLLQISSTWPAAAIFFCSPGKLHMAGSSKVFLFSRQAPNDQQQQDVSVLQKCQEWFWGPHSLLNEWVWRSLSLFCVKWLGNESNTTTYC